MSRKTRVSISMVAEFDHSVPFFNIKNNREGHLLVSSIKKMLSDVAMERRVKMMSERTSASSLDDPDSKLSDLQGLYLENEILSGLVTSLEDQGGKIEIQVVNKKK